MTRMLMKKVPSHWGYGDPMCEKNAFEFERPNWPKDQIQKPLFENNKK